METMLLINIINTFSSEFIFIEYVQNAINIQIILERQVQSIAQTQIVLLDKGELLVGMCNGTKSVGSSNLTGGQKNPKRLYMRIG